MTQKSCAVGMRNAKLGNHLNTIIRRYNYFEQNLLEHAMIGYLDYMSMTVRNQRWTRSKYFRIGCQVVRNRRLLLTDR